MAITYSFCTFIENLASASFNVFLTPSVEVRIAFIFFLFVPNFEGKKGVFEFFLGIWILPQRLQEFLNQNRFHSGLDSLKVVDEIR